MKSEAGPAIKALGSLFKLTEVYIWDAGTTEAIEVRLESSQSPKLTCQDGSSGSSVIVTETEFRPDVEDQEWIKEMDALGLPLVFQSNKEVKSNKTNKTSKNKRKGSRLKMSCGVKEFMDEELEIIEVSGNENASPSVLHDSDRKTNSLCCMPMPSQSESYCCDVAVDVRPADEHSLVSARTMNGAHMDHSFHGTIEDLSNSCQECDFMSKDGTFKGTSSNTSDSTSLPASCLTDSQVNSEEELSGDLMVRDHLQDTVITHHDEKGEDLSDAVGSDHGRATVVSSQNLEVEADAMLETQNCDADHGDWMVYWDEFYMRNYFYNVKTGDSTWDPPPGLDHLASHCFVDESNQVTAKVTVVNHDPSVSSSSHNCCDSVDETMLDTMLRDPLSNAVSSDSRDTDNTSIPSTTVPTVDDNLELSGKQREIKHSCDEKLSLNILSEEYGNNSLMGTLAEEANSSGNTEVESMDPAIEKLEIMPKKKKKKARKFWIMQQTAAHGLQCEDMVEDFPANIGKYWCQRYHLFSRFDSGITMDEEGWFSVTPELIAKHHALRCACDVLIDCFTGVGGNAIQFAQMCNHVTAIDIDPKKIGYAYHNAAIYGVDQIDFIIGDFFTLAPKLKANCVFLSPPWGGPDYARVKTYDIKTMLKPCDGYYLFSIAKQIARKVVMFLPKNINPEQLAEMSLSADPPWSLEVEKNYLNGKLKGITAYFSDTRAGETP